MTLCQNPQDSPPDHLFYSSSDLDLDEDTRQTTIDADLDGTYEDDDHPSARADCKCPTCAQPPANHSPPAVAVPLQTSC